MTVRDLNRRNSVLNFLRECDYSPTVREIGRAVGLKSSSSVHRHLRELERDGFIGYEGRRIYVTERAA